MGTFGILEPSRLMKRLLDGAIRKMTPQELSASVNGQLSPEECVVRLREFLGSVDYLDDVAFRRLLLVEIGNFLESLRTDAIDLGAPRARDTFLKTLKIMLDEASRQMPELDDMISTIGKAHAEMFVQASMAGIAAYRAGLEERLKSHGVPGLEEILAEEDWSALSEVAHEGAMRSLEMRVVDG